MRLTLIGDIHFYRLAVAPWRLLGKRLLGQLNLWARRHRRFNPALLGPVMERVKAVKPDMMLYTGDLTTTALQAEFADVMRVLRAGDAGAPVVMLPGNHDRYTLTATRGQVFEKAVGDYAVGACPMVRPLAGPWTLMAIDAARPVGLHSRGRLGAAQLNAIEQHVSLLSASEGLVMMCHYPVVAPAEVAMPWGHALADRDRLRSILAACKARVVYVHGHIHQPWWHVAADGNGLIDINAGAPCHVSREYPHGQGFWEIELPEDANLPVRARHHHPLPDNASAWIATEHIAHGP